MINNVLHTDGFYFATDYDLTHTLQRLANTSPEFQEMSLLERVRGSWLTEARMEMLSMKLHLNLHQKWKKKSCQDCSIYVKTSCIAINNSRCLEIFTFGMFFIGGHKHVCLCMWLCINMATVYVLGRSTFCLEWPPAEGIPCTAGGKTALLFSFIAFALTSAISQTPFRRSCNLSSTLRNGLHLNQH